jgi:hypothetical protein
MPLVDRVDANGNLFLLLGIDQVEKHILNIVTRLKIGEVPAILSKCLWDH